MQTLTMVLVEDDPGDAGLIRYALKYSGTGHALSWVTSLSALAEHLEASDAPDVVLLDLNLPDSTGMATVEGCKSLVGDIPIVVLTGHDDMAFSLQTLEAGAQDYLIKGNLDADSLLRSVRYAISRARLEQRLRLSEARMAAAIEGANLGLWDWLLPERQFVSLNEQWLAMLGFSADEITLPQPVDAWLERLHSDDRSHFNAALAAHLEQRVPNIQCEVRMRHRKGHWVWVMVSGHMASRTPDGSPQRLVGVQQDISERRAMAERLEAQAMTDALTGLPNRRHFMQAMDYQYGRIRRHPELSVCVLMLDIDHFKRVNDTYGHAGGDVVLSAFAEAITGQLRETDIAGRLGGEEFAVVLPETDAVGGRRVAEKLRQAVEAMRVTLEDGTVVQITTSLGLTLMQADDTRPDGALARADGALYRAKREGRNQVVACPNIPEGQPMRPMGDA
ncbi:GGDEF domain-containing response regulator [Billgrantia kenyensis]|uniref:diguanylate cyclase n=1 Tax=Billgrantia kenyensis TaxID=321266 RepID=A0A7V9W1P4_9GAMM|nr:diguanylate cyclase [Halomonas kenyensis]MBA2779413.1 diguanylate cyclase [Halomonas kenyensis]MCG6662439.1 diguanylate cyclase [Halomonas kenyensis]